MSTVYPISSVSNQKTNTTNSSSSGTDNLANEDTFLKLLVAQLKYQDPMAPTDGTQFLTQTAQFTELETLQKIASQQDAQAKSGQMLAAATMVGRSVTYSLGTNGQATTPTGTSMIEVRGALSKDAAVGSKSTISTSIYSKAGTKVPLDLTFTKTADGYSVQAVEQRGQRRWPDHDDVRRDRRPCQQQLVDRVERARRDRHRQPANWPAGGITSHSGRTPIPPDCNSRRVRQPSRSPNRTATTATRRPASSPAFT